MWIIKVWQNQKMYESLILTTQYIEINFSRAHIWILSLQLSRGCWAALHPVVAIFLFENIFMYINARKCWRKMGKMYRIWLDAAVVGGTA